MEFAADWIERYATHLTAGGNSPQTVRHRVTLAMRAAKWGVERGWLAVQPRKPKLPTVMRAPRDVTPERLRRVFAGLRARPGTRRAADLLTFIAETGCRPGEACRLTWSDVDLAARTATLRAHKTGAKSGTARTIYLTPPALALLAARQNDGGVVFRSRLGRAYTPGGLRAILRRATRGAVITPYQLRHTFAQAQEDLPDEVLSGLLGHSDPRSVRVYRQIRSERLRRAAASARSPLAG